MKRYSQTEGEIKRLLEEIFVNPKMDYQFNPKMERLIAVTENTNEIERLVMYKSINTQMPILCVPEFIKGFTEHYYSSSTACVAENKIDEIKFHHRYLWNNDFLNRVYGLVPSVSHKTILLARDIAMDMVSLTEGNLALVSGPISTGGKNSINENLIDFNRDVSLSAKRLNKIGTKVFNQMPFEPFFSAIHTMIDADSNDSYKGQIYLDHFYGPLLETKKFSTLVQRKGWETSTGATWEYEKAKKLGMRIIQMDVEIMEELPNF